MASVTLQLAQVVYLGVGIDLDGACISTLENRIVPYLQYFTLPYSASAYFTLPYLTLPYSILPYFISTHCQLHIDIHAFRAPSRVKQTLT